MGKKLALVSILSTLFFIPLVIGQQPPEVGIVEKLGQYVPMESKFYDENGKELALRDFITKPTILNLVYYRCPGICGPLMNALELVLQKIELEPGQDFNVLSISFDHRENFEIARGKRKSYLLKLRKKRKFPDEAWRFLTGSKENIRKLTDSVGFYFKKVDNDYRHPGTLIVLSPEGKISRYLFGGGASSLSKLLDIKYLPFDLKMAIIEASEGKVGPTIAKLLRFCYSYDPRGKRYGLRVMRVAGAAVVFFIFIFVLFLCCTGKKKSGAPAKAESENQDLATDNKKES